MTILTDKVIVENGADYTFVCHKIPFAISCCSDFPHGDNNLIDLDLVNKMKIPLRNIKVTRMSTLGHDVRAVGRIKQTVQCVHKGRVQGTVHLEAKVVKDLFSLSSTLTAWPAPKPTNVWLGRSLQIQTTVTSPLKRMKSSSTLMTRSKMKQRMRRRKKTKKKKIHQIANKTITSKIQIGNQILLMMWMSVSCHGIRDTQGFCADSSPTQPVIMKMIIRVQRYTTRKVTT